MEEVKETTSANVTVGTNQTTSNVEAVFTKEQILKSKKYRGQRDLINALLVNESSYTLSTVDQMIDKFMKEGV